MHVLGNVLEKTGDEGLRFRCRCEARMLAAAKMGLGARGQARPPGGAGPKLSPSPSSSVFAKIYLLYILFY